LIDERKSTIQMPVGPSSFLTGRRPLGKEKAMFRKWRRLRRMRQLASLLMACRAAADSPHTVMLTAVVELMDKVRTEIAAL